MLLSLTDEEISKTTLKFPKDLMKRVKQYALDNDTNITAVIINALTLYLDKKKQ